MLGLSLTLLRLALDLNPLPTASFVAEITDMYCHA
jgi:hypothetical protein